MPIVHPLPSGFSVVQAFNRLSHLPGCLWLDAAAPGPSLSPAPGTVGRYSFLCADPVATIRCRLGDRDPWPELRQWAKRLPADRRVDLPPFQGGIAGLWGYEAANWLEPVGHAAGDDLPTPAVSVGLYDWVIAHDSLTGASWLISQGFRDDRFVTDLPFAEQRRDHVLKLLDTPCGDQPSAAGVVTQLAPQKSTPRAGVTSNFTSQQFRAAIDEIIARIRRGDSFQVNLAQRLLVAATMPSPSLYLRLRQANPAPLAGYYDGGDFQVLSSSPEGFLRIRDRSIETRPIKGTVARTGDPQADHRAAEWLVASDKDNAENVMIVDLMRNDLSRVCDDASVVVPQLCQVERYAFVQHLVSVVRGRLRDGLTAIDALAACFPGGSVTGAPKIEAMRTIAELEPHRRGPYCGSLGYVSCGGDAEFNILIRTLTATGGWWQLPVGGGITARSHSGEEERETWVKAEGMLRAIPGVIMPS